jgi:hypothetical protein
MEDYMDVEEFLAAIRRVDVPEWNDRREANAQEFAAAVRRFIATQERLQNAGAYLGADSEEEMADLYTERMDAILAFIEWDSEDGIATAICRLVRAQDRIQSLYNAEAEDSLDEAYIERDAAVLQLMVARERFNRFDTMARHLLHADPREFGVRVSLGKPERTPESNRAMCKVTEALRQAGFHALGMVKLAASPLGLAGEPEENYLLVTKHDTDSKHALQNEVRSIIVSSGGNPTSVRELESAEIDKVLAEVA